MRTLARKSIIAFAVAAALAAPAVQAQGAPAGRDPIVTYSQPDFTSTATITRSEVVARAKTWVDERVPYDMGSNHRSGWRKDCSGFVSMAWNLTKSGLSTVTLVNPQVSHPITKDALLPGDILINGGPGTEGANGHVRLFGGWLDSAKNRYWVYEQTPPQATYNEYTWSATAAAYPPYRYNSISDDVRKPRAGVNDVNGDGWGDLLVTKPGGDLVHFGNSINVNPAQPYGTGERVGTGFQQYTTVRSADLTGDGYAELVGVRSDGALHYWENNKNSNPSGVPYTSSRPAGNGFDVFQDFTLADVSGDGYADLLGIKANGEVLHYPNNINSNPDRVPFVTGGERVGTGFHEFAKVRAADLTGDGYAELVAVKPTGELFYWENNKNSNPGSAPYTFATSAGDGFDIYSDFALADVSGDGYADLTAWKSDGSVFYYPNNINTNADREPYGHGGLIGEGFQIFNRLI